ncbi:MAG TPA: PASTA domain-containing protein [Gemmatimonadaceae bacterium]|nr:PASTA domain-containing protein [Gemmatimonadaceae bacterium]
MNLRTLSRRAFPYLIVGVGGFLIAYLLLFFFAFPAEVLPDDGRIPRVVGMTYDAASAALEKVGFHALKGETRFSKTTPQDVILEQDPPAGSLQKRGANVTLAVSGGQATATVPEVAGSSQQQAQIAIENAGFTFGTISQQTSNLARGAVISSNPPAGTALELPATVSIVLSQGPSTIQIPDLTGRTLPDARSTLEQLGLHLGATSRDTSSFAPENTILSQAPAPGATVSAGASVNLRISRFPPPPPVPSIDTTHPDSLQLSRSAPGATR